MSDTFYKNDSAFPDRTEYYLQRGDNAVLVVGNDDGMFSEGSKLEPEMEPDGEEVAARNIPDEAQKALEDAFQRLL